MDVVDVVPSFMEGMMAVNRITKANEDIVGTVVESYFGAID